MIAHGVLSFHQVGDKGLRVQTFEKKSILKSIQAPMIARNESKSSCFSLNFYTWEIWGRLKSVILVGDPCINDN